MRIGIVPQLNPSAGGEYQHTLNFLEALAKLAQRDQEDEYILFVQPEYEPFLSHLSGAPWSRVSFPPPPSFTERALNLLRARHGKGWVRQAWRRMWSRPARMTSPVLSDPESILPDPEQIQWRPEISRWFKRHRVDWVLYPNPTPLSFEARLPYVMLVPDIGHRVHPELPDFSTGGYWEWREYVFRNGIRYATLIMADSEVGKEDILEFYGRYGITSDRVKVLPNVPPIYLSTDVSESKRAQVRRTHHLPERYLFYPAQFWPHKNHAGIVQALGLLKKDFGAEVHIVFCGSYQGENRDQTFQEMMTLARRLGVAHQVHCPGYVPDEDMSGLYAEAVGLVIPLFLATANIPILEAWAFGCPVLASDIRGVREQVGDAGLLVDPYSVEAISEGIYRLWTDEALRRELAERGRQRLARYTRDDFCRLLADIIREANQRVREGDAKGRGLN